MRINNTNIAKTIGVVLMTIFLLSILTACVSKPKPVKNINPIADAKTLGKALGCVMAPNTCKSSKQEDNKQDEITKEFDKMDAEREADQKRNQPASK